MVGAVTAMLSGRSLGFDRQHPATPLDWRDEVWVDGVRYADAFQYSIAGGYADVYLTDASGGRVKDIFDRDKTAHVRGAVEVRRCNA
jgi:hypothetical protein